jgi:hypothetical protein
MKVYSLLANAVRVIRQIQAKDSIDLNLSVQSTQCISPRPGITTCIFDAHVQWVAVLPELVTRVTAVATTPLGYIHITI